MGQKVGIAMNRLGAANRTTMHPEEEASQEDHREDRLEDRLEGLQPEEESPL